MTNAREVAEGARFCLVFPQLERALGAAAAEGSERWSPFTALLARRGWFGDADLPAAEWPERLDELEAALVKFRLRKGRPSLARARQRAAARRAAG